MLLIPLIWPIYAISTGQLEEWLDGVVWQANRGLRPFGDEMRTIFVMMDPIILLLGAAGLIYAVVKKDYFVLLWGFPYLIFIFFVNWVFFFHIIPVIALFCIGGTVFLFNMIQKMRNNLIVNVSEFLVFSAIVIFGLVNSTLLITQNVNDSNFKLASVVTGYLPNKDDGLDNQTDKVTLIGPNGAFSMNWIPKYVFNKNFDFKWFEKAKDYIEAPIQTKDFLMIADAEMREAFSGNSTREHIIYVSKLYNNSNMFVVIPNNPTSFPDIGKYPYTNIRDEVFGENLNFRGIQWNDKIEVKGNYANKTFR